MADKFVRALNYDTGSTNNARISHPLKLIYEFWGYCVNGTSSLTSPGGFASITPMTVTTTFQGGATTIAAGSNGASLPQATINVVSTTGFPTSGVVWVYTSAGTQQVNYTGLTGTTLTGCTGGTGTLATGNTIGSSSLMTYGNDGYTNATTVFRQDGYASFYSPSNRFHPNMVGQVIVTWKAGSNSSEDAIYMIQSYISPNELIIDVNHGGTPGSEVDGYRPTFTNRTNINYRVVDVTNAALSTSDGQYLVFQFDPSAVNAGQANSQLKLNIASSNLSLTAQMSPGGTWNGSAFSDGTSLISPNYQQLITSTSTVGQFYINLWGDKDYLIYQSSWRGTTNGVSNGGHHMHVEIPERMYTQAQDPNPITISLNGRNSSGASLYLTSNEYFRSYGGGFVMRCADGVIRNTYTVGRALGGAGNNSTNTGGSTGGLPLYMNVPGNSLNNPFSAINPILGTILTTYGYLSYSGTPGQFSLARVKLRKVRFANIVMPMYTRISANGDFIITMQGICLPWDKTVLPYPLFLY